MNIIEMEDMVKGLPDQLLMQEAQAPSGRIPQFLALSEVQRRKEMRDRFQQQAPQATVKDQILQSGIAAALPQGPPGMPPQMPPQGQPPAPPMGAPPGPPQGAVMAYGGGQMPYFMYGGGQVPYRMQEGRTVPSERQIQEILRKGPAARTPEENEILRAAGLSLSRQELPQDSSIARLEQVIGSPFIRETIGLPNLNEQELRTATGTGAINERIARMLGASQAAPAAPPAPPAPAAAPSPTEYFAGYTPGQSIMGAQRGTSLAPSAAPTGAPGAAPAIDVTGSNVDIATLFPQARSVIGGRGSGMPRDIAGAMKPYEDILAIDPNSFKGPDFTPLIEEQRKRGSERAASYEQTIKGIEDEMKRERLGAVLTTLGANLMAGEGALGLEKAGTIAQQIGKEMRQEVGAERRAAKAAEDATADRIFALNAQQLTADKEAQRALYTAQRGVKEKALEFLQKDIGDERQAQQAANQLAATLTVSMVNSIRDKVVSEGADRRSALSFAQSLAKEQFEILAANPQLASMPREELQNLVNQTMRAALETAFSAVGTAPPATFNTSGPRQAAPAQSGPREKTLSSFMSP